jgi:plasmid stabilization system protein ParE
MTYEISLTAGAERDLEDLYDYFAESDSPAKADYVLGRLLEQQSDWRRSPIMAPVRKNCRRSASGNIAKPSSSPVA